MKKAREPPSSLVAYLGGGTKCQSSYSTLPHPQNTLFPLTLVTHLLAILPMEKKEISREPWGQVRGCVRDGLRERPRPTAPNAIARSGGAEPNAKNGVPIAPDLPRIV